MLAGSPPLRSLAVLLVLFAALAAAPRPEAKTAAQATAGGVNTGTWNREPEQGGWRVAIQFTNYNGDRLTAAFPISRVDVDQATGEYGYKKAEVGAILKDCRRCTQAEFDRRVSDFYHRQGFGTEQTPGLTRLLIDMPEVVRRNTARVHAAAVEVERIARERNYDSTATVGALLSLVQTGITYFAPPMEEDGREIFGLYVPPQVLVNGRGDCDSKTALIASVLKNFSSARMIGVNLPNHYLMGIARVPQRGEAYVEYAGDQYVLLEPAGPGWLPPGTVSDYSLNLVGTMRDVRIDPFR